MSLSLDSITCSHLIDGVEGLLLARVLQVDQNEIWLGLEPAECKVLLEHFRAPTTSQRLPGISVLSSADPKALGLRNRSAGPRPTLLVILDERWESRSQDFGQSLFDLSRKQISELFRERVKFAIETKWLELAKRDEQREWIHALFNVLRGIDQKLAVRDRDGQAMRMPLSLYFGYLAHTLEGAGEAPEEALARGLHWLGLFTHPALAWELRPKRTPASKQQVRERMAASLSQNFRAARDPDDFAAQLASSQRTAERVLDDYLKKGGRLSSDPDREEAAREAFRAFLRQQDVRGALRSVDWEFHEATSASETRARRGGRKRRFGVRGVLADRDSLAEKRQRIIEIFVQRAPAGQEEQTRQDIERLADELGRGATADAALQDLRSRALSLWKDASDKALEQLLGSLDTIHRRAKRRDTVDIEANSLVAGLVEFGVWVRKISDGLVPEEWTITYPQKATQRIEPMSQEWRRKAHTLLRAAVQSCLEDEPFDLAEDEEPPDAIPVPLELAAGKLTRQLVLQAPRNWARDDFRSKLGQPRQLILDMAAEPTDLERVRSPMDLPPAVQEVAGSISALARELDPCGPYCLEEIRNVVICYGELLAKASSASLGDTSRRLAELQERLKKEKPGPERTSLLEQIAEITGQSHGEASRHLSDSEIRALARFQTLLPEIAEKPSEVSVGPNVGWLMPLHPLCLRARAVTDEVSLMVLAALMDPQRQLSELQLALLSDALEEISVPEPCRFLAPWSTADRWPPLMFQAYDQNFAAFVASQGTSASYGREVVLQVLRDYVALYPTAKDRLVLYLEADDGGRLAHELSTALVFPSEEGQGTLESMDLRLAGSEDGHFAYLAERAAARAGIDEALFGIARGRLKPRVLFRTTPLASVANPESICHIAVAYAGRKRPGTEPLLEGAQHPHPRVDVAAGDPLCLASVIAPCALRIPESGTMLRAFSTRDRLDRSWEEIQARVHWQQIACQFATEVNLAPEQNGAPLRALHSTADWVVILSQLPVHRAIEVFDHSVVRLIDRKRFFDSGRECHVTVSTSHSRVIEDLLGLEIERACGKRPATLDGLLAFVQRFAPGLAMRCVGRPEHMGPAGILGLLLTAQEGELKAPGSVAVPLDEHPWIYGQGGVRADVLLVTTTESAVRLQILEAKYSKDGSEEAARKAVQQVQKSVTALRAWMELSEIQAYFRRRLYDMLIAHGMGNEQRQALAQSLVDGKPLEASETSDVHIWVWSADVITSASEEAGVRTLVHSPSETRNRLLEMAGAPT